MPERFGEIEKAVVAQGNQEKLRVEEIRPADRDLIRKLEEYPELKAKIENLLGVIENAGGDVEKAAEAERRIITELQQLGNDILHSWDPRYDPFRNRRQWNAGDIRKAYSEP